MINDSILRNTLDLHHDLEAVDAISFTSQNLIAEPLDEVLADDAVGRRSESDDMRDEVTFIIVQRVLPVVKEPCRRRSRTKAQPSRTFATFEANRQLQQ